MEYNNALVSNHIQHEGETQVRYVVMPECALYIEVHAQCLYHEAKPIKDTLYGTNQVYY